MTVSETQHFKTELPGIYPSILYFGFELSQNFDCFSSVDYGWIFGGNMIYFEAFLTNASPPLNMDFMKLKIWSGTFRIDELESKYEC